MKARLELDISTSHRKSLMTFPHKVVAVSDDVQSHISHLLQSEVTLRILSYVSINNSAAGINDQLNYLIYFFLQLKVH